jgi:hypothetical protein
MAPLFASPKLAARATSKVQIQHRKSDIRCGPSDFAFIT